MSDGTSSSESVGSSERERKRRKRERKEAKRERKRGRREERRARKEAKKRRRDDVDAPHASAPPAPPAPSALPVPSVPLEPPGPPGPPLAAVEKPAAKRVMGAQRPEEAAAAQASAERARQAEADPSRHTYTGRDKFAAQHPWRGYK